MQRVYAEEKQTQSSNASGIYTTSNAGQKREEKGEVGGGGTRGVGKEEKKH